MTVVHDGQDRQEIKDAPITQRALRARGSAPSIYAMCLYALLILNARRRQSAEISAWICVSSRVSFVLWLWFWLGMTSSGYKYILQMSPRYDIIKVRRRAVHATTENLFYLDSSSIYYIGTARPVDFKLAIKYRYGGYYGSQSMPRL
jgi:signal transduction histidine kinase